MALHAEMLAQHKRLIFAVVADEYPLGTDALGRDVLPAMRWYPVVTFLQVTADLALAYGAPPGHGHRFHAAAVAAWAAIDAPPGWAAADTARLTALLGP